MNDAIYTAIAQKGGWVYPSPYADILYASGFIILAVGIATALVILMLRWKFV